MIPIITTIHANLIYIQYEYRYVIVFGSLTNNSYSVQVASLHHFIEDFGPRLLR